MQTSHLSPAVSPSRRQHSHQNVSFNKAVLYISDKYAETLLSLKWLVDNNNQNTPPPSYPLHQTLLHDISVYIDPSGKKEAQTKNKTALLKYSSNTLTHTAIVLYPWCLGSLWQQVLFPLD